MHAYQIETAIGDLTSHRQQAIDPEPAAGEVIAGIERCAITANNVTYAVHHGPPLHYGRFFPTSDPATRITVPLWGFATITASRAEGLHEGDRFYGYWPAASHARLLPGALRHGAFDDTAPHRAAQAPVYNHYVPAAPSEQDGLMALFRPLFGTAFALDDALGRRPAAGTIILTSASSRTALGLAWLLRRRPGLKLIGLTSASHQDFVEKTGYYDQVVGYNAVETLNASEPAVLVDFAGNGPLKARIHRHLPGLKASHVVGDTHWSEPQATDLSGPAPALFFAPASIAAMVARDGAPAFQAHLDAAIAGFLSDASQWLTLAYHRGYEEFVNVFNSLVDGHSHPAQGHLWAP